jgi:MFS family permease
VRLPESLPAEKRARALRAPGFSLSPQRLREIAQFPKLPLWLALFFGVTFAFTHMEQTFSLLFQTRFGFETGDAGYRTGLILMWAGLIGAALQGGAIRKLAPRFGEWKLLVAGLVLNVIGMAIFPWGASYASYFAIILPLAIGSSLVNPALSALISRSAPADRQGVVMGISQGLGSLARAVGPFCGLLAFSAAPFAPYVVASALSLVMLVFALRAGTSHARAITNS